METILIAYDLWDIVEGLPQLQQNPGAESDSTGEGSEAESTPEEKHAATRENKIRNAKALSLIQGALSDDLFPRIRNEKSAQGAWNVLKREYRGDKRVRAVKLQAVRGEFEYMRMGENESLDHYLAKFFDAINSLKSLGEDVPEIRIVQKLLMSLNRRYKVEEVIASVKVFDKREDMHDEREEQRGTENAFSSLKVGYNQGPANNKFKVTQAATKREMCIIIIAQAGTIELELTTTIPTIHRTYKAAAVKV
ncbi:TMV resistance protein [Salix suchowensis]|nr:TMV resistance protein [Salix suchowensis]